MEDSGAFIYLWEKQSSTGTGQGQNRRGSQGRWRWNGIKMSRMWEERPWLSCLLSKSGWNIIKDVEFFKGKAIWFLIGKWYLPPLPLGSGEECVVMKGTDFVFTPVGCRHGAQQKQSHTSANLLLFKQRAGREEILSLSCIYLFIICIASISKWIWGSLQ